MSAAMYRRRRRKAPLSSIMALVAVVTVVTVVVVAGPVCRASSPVQKTATKSPKTSAAAAPVTGESYVLESASTGALGGASSSPTYDSLAIAGQATSSGQASSPSFSSSSGLLNDVDLDGDGVRGTDDLCPIQNATCSDANVDGCIDLPDLDYDSDGVTAGNCDCNDSVGTIWGTPGEVESLVLTHNPVSHQTTLTWPLPVEPGGTAVMSDILRSSDPSNFTTNVDCVLSNGAGTAAIDPQSPPPGASFYYLVRAENLCPAVGSLGTDSRLHLRVGRTCP